MSVAEAESVTAAPQHRMRILVVDDEAPMCDVVQRFLRRWGYETQSAQGGHEAMEVLRSGFPADVVITDLTMPGMDGMELLEEIRRFDSHVETVMMTGYGSVESAVEAMRQGAHDYLNKPLDFDQLRIIMSRLQKTRQLTDEVKSLRLELQKKYEGGTRAALVGSSPAMQRIGDTIQKLSRSKTSVLIQGDSGTGKELVARAIHYSGITADKPFLAINCGGVSRTLLESQLFGHVKGAFTNAYSDQPGYFREASGGTLMLDEITEMDADVQVKLLRVLQEREVTPVGATKPVPVDVRIIAATNRPLEEALESGKLRQDLYYRLNVVTINLPTLAERREDIPELVRYFNTRFANEFGVRPKPVPMQTMNVLMQYDWPGNVRELENVLQRAFALSEGEVELPADFGVSSSAPPSPRQGVLDSPVPGTAPAAQAGALQVLDEDHLPTLDEAEEVLLRAAMKRAGGVKRQAADILGLERRRLYRMLKKHGI